MKKRQVERKNDFLKRLYLLRLISKLDIKIHIFYVVVHVAVYNKVVFSSVFSSISFILLTCPLLPATLQTKQVESDQVFCHSNHMFPEPSLTVRLCGIAL